MDGAAKDERNGPSRLLAPIDASYKPSRSIEKLPATASLEEIISVLEEDGCVILADFLAQETVDKIEEELEPYTKSKIAKSDTYDNFFGRKTLIIPAIVSKSDTVADILSTNETIDKLLKELLEERYPAVFETHTEDLVLEPLLSTSLAFYINEASPRQSLHRDDMVFCSKHVPNQDIRTLDGFSVFLAVSKITRENGGTMVIPGSHKWEHGRQGRSDEVTFLEMERGSAFILLSNMAHGAGYNTIPNEVRKIINLVFCRGNLRTEENQFLANPRSKVLKMSPKVQSLLGFKKPEKCWVGIVENEDPSKDLEGIYERLMQ
ncbi:phytanoyl-CoA dioxygenase [Xylariaceae sp. FL0594]|nr:phytanoyl-CoA dioxygenase [Xylariaceae sp. FL0594]